MRVATPGFEVTEESEAMRDATLVPYAYWVVLVGYTHDVKYHTIVISSCGRKVPLERT